MKYISFVVPCYNAEAYLAKNLDSLLIGGEDVEIIVVNDGSKDNTKCIAEEYEKKYPNVIKVINKENGGHGSAINAGIRTANGLYFKCVDADDWVDKNAYLEVLSTIKKHHAEGTNVDLYFTNFVFERLDNNTQKLFYLGKHFPKHRVFTWKDMKPLGLTEFLMMHSMIYKLDVLKESNTELLHHTFYVDNIYVYEPLPWVKDICYIDCDFYRYYVGRPDQSVTLENMKKNYEHQLRMMGKISTVYSYDFIYSLDKYVRKVMIHQLVILSYVTLFYVLLGNDKKRDDSYRAYWNSFKEKQPKLYRKIRYRSYFLLPFLLIKPLCKLSYKIGYNQVIKKTGWHAL